MPRTLSIDIETFSGYDLKDVGVYRYTESPDFTILLFAYAFDNEPAEVIDLANGADLPGEVMDALLGYDDVTLCAHNAAFERVCINRHFGIVTAIEQWNCTMVHAAMLGLPLALGQVAKVLKLEDQKDSQGTALIRYFCVPCKATKTNSQRTRNLPEHDTDKWSKFIEYCRQDVVVERKIRNTVDFYTIPAAERELYVLDQIMNDKGVLLDRQLIQNAIEIGNSYKQKLQKEAIEITGLANPNSRNQLIAWLESETDDKVKSLTKESVTALIGTVDNDIVRRVLFIRQEANKTSTSKYVKMLEGICSDGRYRGLVQFYGANRTGRDAGRGWQPQNVPKIKLKDIDFPRQLVKAGNSDLLEMLYDSVPTNTDNLSIADYLKKIEPTYANVPGVLSQLIRTAIVAPINTRFIVSDFKAIEARVIAWLAGETWAIEAFNTHGKIYEAAASRMFGVPMESIDKNSPLRDKGKVGTLSLGFQGGVDALIKMGALAMGLPESDLQPLVTAWRQANPNIVKYWYAVEDAAVTAVDTGERQTISHGISFWVERNVLFIQLPSGRKLSYFNPKIRREIKVFVEFLKPVQKYKEGQKSLLPVERAMSFSKDGYCKITSEPKEKLSLNYEGLDQVKKIWCRIDTYGGKLVENIVQAVARDALMLSFAKLAKKGYCTVMRIHDELIAEMQNEVGSLKEVEAIMSEPIPWAPGLPLGADGFESNYYKK